MIYFVASRPGADAPDRGDAAGDAPSRFRCRDPPRPARSNEPIYWSVQNARGPGVRSVSFRKQKSVLEPKSIVRWSFFIVLKGLQRQHFFTGFVYAFRLQF